MAPAKDLVIAIDGPAGVGKSTTAKLVAQQLDMAVLDTGSLYRSVGLAVLSAGLDPNVADDCAEALMSCQLVITGEGRTAMYGEEVPQFVLRGAMVSKASSEVAQHGVVREYLLETQRRALQKLGPLVAEGRDIGTVIFPNALLKVFLTADESIRMERMTGKQLDMGKSQSEAEKAAADVAVRDVREMTRLVAPMIVAEDAIAVDTSHLTMKEVVQQICAQYSRRLRLQQA